MPHGVALVQAIAAAFGVDHRAYAEMPWVYQVAWKMESLLRGGVCVGFNSDRHTRVAVACNNHSLLCVDSYGARHQEGNERRYWRAGLSVVDKWVVYNWVRELMWFEDAPASRHTSSSASCTGTL